MYHVTLGKVSSSIRQDATNVVKKSCSEIQVEFLDGKRVMLMLRDYLDGVAPPIPSLNLEMESGSGVKVNGVLDRYDKQCDIESWVFSMRGDAIAEIFDIGNIRLFARNIRGFLGGATDVNKGMTATLKSEPEKFFYYNNGITLLCDSAEKITSKGRDILRVGNPQIINGQQTTRTLASANKKDATKASVLVKVIQVPREINTGSDGFESLVSRIVAGTNWQNAIKQSDLMSNDRKQIDLERELRNIGYLYVRKRQSKSEARRSAGCKYLRVIKKDELAKSVAGCDLDPVDSRSGKENLYDEAMYPSVFPNSDPNYYWLVQNFVWSHLAPHVRAKKNAEAFRYLFEYWDEDLKAPLRSAIKTVFAACRRYFIANRGSGPKALDPSTFYRNKRGRHKEFSKHWQSKEGKSKKKFDRAMGRVELAIKSYRI